MALLNDIVTVISAINKITAFMITPRLKLRDTTITLQRCQVERLVIVFTVTQPPVL